MPSRLGKSLLVLPILLCLALVLWKNCVAKSSTRLIAKKLGWIEPPEGMEWWKDDDEEEKGQVLGNIRRRPVQRRAGKEGRQMGENAIHVDFGPIHGEGAYSLFGAEEEGPELGEPIPWFGEWERMVGGGGKKQVEEARKMHRLRPAKKNAIHRHSPSPSSPIAPRRFRNIREDQPCLLQRKKPLQHRTYPRSYDFPGFELSIPRQWDWRNVSGTNYCSPNRNQHIPVYCGGCWVFGTLGMLNDRFNVARKNRWPMTFLSPQEIIACNGKGSCNGGTAEDVFEHAKTVGLVEEGCNNFKAVNEKCTPFTRCGSCWPDNCFAIQNYTRYYIKDFGTVSGRLQMMSEIHNRGPIACTVGCTSNFDLNYTSGIFQEFGESPMNHIVSVTGWGWDEEAKTEYWIVRNSWGDAWGESGWFRIVTSLFKGGRGDQYNMGIERQCYFADPDISNLDN